MSNEKFPYATGEAGPIKRNYGNYTQLPFSPKLRDRVRELRKAGNLAEVLLWKRLKNKQFKGYDFDRQKIIGNYIVDFFCVSKNVVLGDRWKLT